MVECTGLENQRTARYRGFESLSLRTENLTILLGFFYIFLSLKIETLLTIIIRTDNNRKESLIPLLSAISPKIGAIIANEILSTKLLTDITVALMFDLVFRLIWFFSIGVTIPLK